MKTILILLLLFSASAQARTSDYVKPGQCLPTFPYVMYVMSKSGPNQYFVAQSGSGLSEMGAIGMKHKAQSNERLNIMVEYLTTKKIKGADGFEHEVDLWRECFGSKK